MSAPTVPLAVDAPPPAPPRRPPGRAALAVLAAAVVGFGAVDVLGDLTATRTESAEVFAGPVTALHVVGDTGDVRVTAADVTDVRVRTLVHSGWSQPGSSAELTDGVVRLSSACSGGAWMSPCEVSWEVTVPQGLDLDLRTGTGDQSLDGGFGRVVSVAGTGDLHAAGADADDLSAQTGTGDVELAGRYDALRVRTGTGDVAADLRAAPGSVQVTTGTGDATVRLPAAAEGYDATASSGTGDVTLDVPVNSTSERQVRVSASTGDATVLTR
ncbi:DUF4097 family beta strand repeat-containing protein [Kineococcus arenarius]|uniref:DUF4097 family beta strand repeat-containing protein n=1 Tax=unclassified Kineococcus TaxID=2621656 RepID=UPI003D7C5EED